MMGRTKRAISEIHKGLKEEAKGSRAEHCCLKEQTQLYKTGKQETK
jgi:hypothetical protein